MNSLKKLFSAKNLMILFVAVLAVQILSVDVSFALDDTNDVLQNLAKVVAQIIKIVTFISLLMMNFFGSLLGTDLLTGPDAMLAITPMWIWVRNLTNIAFVLILVGLAFTNLYSSFSKEGGGNWSIKEKLPKVIIALVAINFSLLGFRVVIDAVNLGTVAIFGIADSRLDADNSNLESAILRDKTWIPVSTTSWNNIIEGKTLKQPQTQEEKNKVTGGSSCTRVYDIYVDGDNQVMGYEKGEKKYICRNFRSSMNDMFCSNWMKIEDPDGEINESNMDDQCLFIMKKDSPSSIVRPSDEPGQNLFMSFGTVFMHLERLPALASGLNSLNGVIMNTLFSAVLSLAYLVALIAVFIALLTRVIVIWIALVFSPVLIAGMIMGFGDKAGDLTNKLVTHLIMPLKIGAAFSVSFVMMSAMMEFNTEFSGKGNTFTFGPALSGMGLDEYGFLWQIATIAVFWKAAQWAVEGNLAEKITGYVFNGAQTLGETAARAATIDRQLFSLPTGKDGQRFSLSNLMEMPRAVETANQAHKSKGFEAMKQQFGLISGDFEKFLAGKEFKSNMKGKEFIEDIVKKADSMSDLNSQKRTIKSKLGAITLPWADELKKKIDETGSVSKAIDDYFSSPEGRKKSEYSGYDKGDISDSDFFKGASSTGGTLSEGSGNKDESNKDRVDENGSVDGVPFSAIKSLAESKELAKNGPSPVKSNAGTVGDITQMAKTGGKDSTGKEIPGEYKDGSVLFKEVLAKSTQVQTDINEDIGMATVNTDQSNNDKGLVSLAESENGAVKVTLVEKNGKKPVNLSSLGISNGTGTINNEFVNKVKSTYYDSDVSGNFTLKDDLSDTDKHILKTVETMKDFIQEKVSDLNDKNKSFVSNISVDITP